MFLAVGIMQGLTTILTHTRKSYARVFALAIKGEENYERRIKSKISGEKNWVH